MSRRIAGMARADVKAGRNPGLKANYLKVIDPHTGKWNSQIQLVPSALTEPLSWKKPRRVFVNSMSDLFHEGVPLNFVDKVFAVMALTPQHTFQVLTKRPERMAEYLNVYIRKMMRGYWMGEFGHLANAILGGEVEDEPEWFKAAFKSMKAFHYPDCPQPAKTMGDASIACPWPVPNVWLGTSTENQKTADERIPHLLKCPAAVRFLSCEPLLGPIDLRMPETVLKRYASKTAENYIRYEYRSCEFCSGEGCCGCDWTGEQQIGPGLHWIIVGCESIGSRAGRFADGYESAARSLMEQCQAAEIPFFHKQMPIKGKVSHDPAEWAEDLRVRQFPQAGACRSTAQR
jgi:protein gp37